MDKKKNQEKQDDSIQKQKKGQYSAKDIQVLENIEAVRKRPGMYVGSTDEQGWHHLFQEVIDNSIDEAVAGYCTEIKVILSADQRSLTMEDNGRGIPIEIHPETHRSTLETIFTVLHSGGKFSNEVYKTSGGLHGVGVTAVNALSTSLKVWSRREGKTEYLEFEEGILVNSKITSTPQVQNGITITFTPDQKIFKEFTHFKIEVIQNRLKELAYLNPKLTLLFFNTAETEPVVYHSETGLAGWVKEINQDNGLENTEICAEEWYSSPGENYFYLNFAFQYNQMHRKSAIKSFCNNISTASGGTHAEGFENGLALTCREWIKEKYPGLKVNILKEDVLEGLVVLIAVRMQDPEFAGQTKDRLANKKAREIVKNATVELMQRFFQDHSTTAEAIARKIIDAAQVRIKTEEHQELLREGRQSAILPGKLADCISKKPEENEIFLVEGESAAGTAKLGRDCNFQAVLVLKGKVINVEKSERIKVFKNEEIKNLTNALGFSINEATQNYYNSFQPKLEAGFPAESLQITDDFTYEDEEDQKQTISAYQPLNSEQLRILIEKTRQNLLKKMRYGKIIIMTDADVDGKHIECLVLTFFARYFRYLIEEHRLFLAVPPLYKVQSKKEVKYLYSDQELENYRQEKQKGYTIQRFKGLGEMNAQQLRETTMALRRRCLHQLLYSSPPTIRQIIEEMMGPKSTFRKQRLESGEHKHAQVIVKENNQIEIDQALLVKFLSYAYEVVEDRALPQLQDGLKPVQRRILYTLYELGLLPNKGYRKAAKTVGDVMGKYHPHGEQSIYQAMVKMAQDFNYRYPLVDGQGNWGSLDGDPAAAMRYTEARLSPFGLYLLEDLAFETVEWIDNYDENEKEPKILPASLNLLLNGSSGIAVGMSTNIPPHNLGELADTTIRLVENPTLSTEELFQTFQGPDFPGGGIILEKENLLELYEKGEGTIYIRGKAEIIPSKQEKEKKDLIRITELPFKVNKAKLVERISQVIKDKKIEGLKSVADYSNWEDKVNIHLKFDPNYDGNIILNKLYQTTSLQNSFSVKMRALIDDQPKIFSLKEILQGFIQQRLENIEKKAQFLHQKNKKELINLETRLFIINNYQEIAEITRNSPSEEERDQKLKERFKLDQAGVNRVLDTPANFRQFTPERREKLQKEIADLHQENAKLQQLIASETEKKQKLIEELQALQKVYSHDHRRTIFSDEFHVIDERKLTPHEERIVILSQAESKKENTINTYLNIHEIGSLEGTNIPSQGKELKVRGDGLTIIKLNRRDDLWCFSNHGKLYIISFYKFTAINKSINLREEYGLKLQSREYITYFFSVKEGNTKTEKSLLIITKKGKIKKLNLDRFQKASTSGKKVINLYQKVREKCLHHQSQLEKHKTANCCDKSQGVMAYSRCAEFRDLQKQIKECRECRDVWTGGEDQIVKAALIKENEEIETITKHKDKNRRASIYRKQRRKDEVTEKSIYCSSHQSQLEKHKTANCCDKSQGVMAYSRCLQFKNLKRKIKDCSDCQNPNLFTTKLRKQIKCNQVIDLLIIEPSRKKEDLGLLLIKADNSCLKKPLINLKNELGKDSKLKSVPYCQNHWNKLTKAEEEHEKLETETRENRENLKKFILDSPLEENLKKKLFLFSKITITKEIKEKIANSPVEEMNEQAQQNYQANLEEKASNYHLLLAKAKDKKDKLNKVKEETKKCKVCQGYCEEHKKQRENHKTISHKCGISCPQSRQLQSQVKECSNCQSQKEKKYKLIITNPLIHVRLFDAKGENPEVYLLSQEAVCWYNKKDLASFLEGSNKTRNLLRDKKRKITDIKFYTS